MQIMGVGLVFKVKSLSRVRLFATPWTVAHQAPLSMGFTRQEYGWGCHFLLQGIFSTQGSNPGLLHCRQILNQLSHKGSPRILESFPRQVEKKSRSPQGERALEFSRRKKGQTFSPLHSLGLYNNNVSCLRTVSGLNLLANPVILKCKLWE